jgi:polar amino acid transport system substrate-binding protein
MRIKIAIALIAVTGLLGACGSSKKASSSSATTAPAGSPSSSAPAATKQLTVGTSGDFPPIEYADASSGAIKGFNPTMLSAVLPKAAYSYKYSSMQFSGLISGIQSGRIDVVGLLYVTAEREKVIDFVPFLHSALAVLVRAGDASTINGATALCGKHLGTLQGSPSETTLAESMDAQCKAAGKASITTGQFPSFVQEVTDLGNSRLDGVLEDVLTLSNVAKQNPGKYAVGFTPGSQLTLGLGFQKGSSAKAKIEAALNDWMKTPDYKAAAADAGIPDTYLLTPAA